MGTDIHMAIEVLNHNYDTKRDEWRLAIRREGAFGERNYILFGILAGVRQEDGITPIAEPRGLPEDSDPETIKEAQSGDHSFSWVTLAEVLAYPWDRSFEYTRTMDALNCERLWKLGNPKSWCLPIGGGPTQIISAAQMREKLKAHPVDKYLLRSDRIADLRDLSEPHPLLNFWAEVTWPRAPRACCEDFLAWVKSLEATRIRYAQPDRVRLVFGFDS